MSSCSTTARRSSTARIGCGPIDNLEQIVKDEDIVVGVLAVPNRAAQGIADELVAAGVKIIFNYSEALLQVPPEVTVHTSSPAVDLLYALYFYLT
jgi:redox-sensing transcriptional repressor